MLQALAPYVCAFVGVQPSTPVLCLWKRWTGVGKDGFPIRSAILSNRRTYGIVAIRKHKSPLYAQLGSLYMAGDIRQIIYEEKRTCKF